MAKGTSVQGTMPGVEAPAQQVAMLGEFGTAGIAGEKQNLINITQQEQPLSGQISIEEYEKNAFVNGLKEYIETEPASELTYLLKRSGAYKGELNNLTVNQYKKLTGKQSVQPNILTPDGKHVRWEYALDDIATEYGYDSGEDLKYAIENFGRLKREGVGTPKARGFTGEQPIKRIIEQSKKAVELNRAGGILRIANKIPIVKQLIGQVRPGINFTGDAEKVLVAMKAQTGARADVAVKTLATRFNIIEDFKKLFGTDVLHGAISDIKFIGSKEEVSPINGTLLDIVQRSQLYDLTTEQKTFLKNFEARNNELLAYINDGYGTDVGQYVTDNLEGQYLPNIDSSDEALKRFEGHDRRAIATGRAKTRFYNSAAERMKADSTFKPILDVQKLIEGMDGFKAGAAGGQAFKTALGGKTKEDVMKETHPELYDKMQALKKKLSSLQGSIGTLDRKLAKVIDRFRNSPMEDVDLTDLSYDLDPFIERGQRLGLNKKDIQNMISEVKADIAELRKSWEVANLKPYVFVQDGIYRYFNQDMIPYIKEILKTTDSWLVNMMQNLRGTAFSGDLSPIIGVQTPLGALFDPLGSLQFAGSELKKMSKEGDILRTFTVKGLVKEINDDPYAWGEFFTLLGKSPSGTPQEFAGGFLRFIPGFGQFNEATFTFVIHQMKALWVRQTNSLIKHGVPEIEAKVIAMRNTTEVYPVIDSALMGYSPARAKIINSLVTSISFMYKPAEMITDSIDGIAQMAMLKKPSPRQQLAVERMVILSASCMATSVISAFMNAKANGKDDDETWQAILDVINPNSSDFCAIIVNNNFRIPIGGPYRAIVKALFPQEVEGVPIPVPFGGVGGFLWNRLSPAIGAVRDLVANKDYYGKQIITGTSTIEKIIRGIEYGLESVLPLTLGTIIEDIRKGETANLWEDIMSQFAGFNLNERNKSARTTKDIINKLGNEIVNQDSYNLSDDPNDIYTTAKAYTDIKAKLKYTDGKNITTKNGYSDAAVSAYQAIVIEQTTDYLSNTPVYQINTNSKAGDTIVQYYAQWQEREELIASGVSEDELKDFDSQYPDAYKGNISKAQYDLLLEYSELTNDKDRDAFLIKHPEIATSAREQYLTTNVKENAILALWGQADLYTYEAYQQMVELKTELGIPDNAVNLLPGGDDTYKKVFDYYDKMAAYNKTISDAKSSLNISLSSVTEDNLKYFYWDMEYSLLRKSDGSADTKARKAYRQTHLEYNQYGIDNGWWKAIDSSSSTPTLPTGITDILK
jgi:hypothetical protein